jgi:hypothetical protein
MESNIVKNIEIKPVDIIYVLDESGSMSTMGSEPKDSVNRTIKDQKELNIPGSKFSLIKFNSKVSVVYKDVNLEDVPEFTDYCPSDMTAMYDAIGEAIDMMKAKGDGNYDNVICVILTDGLENCSKKYNLTSIKNMIKEMEKKHSWQFVYAAANQDAFAVGSTIGVSNCVDFEPTPYGLEFMSRGISGGIRRMRSGKSDSVDIYPTVSEPQNIMSPVNTRSNVGVGRDTFLSPPMLKRTRKMINMLTTPPLIISKDVKDDIDDIDVIDVIDVKDDIDTRNLP